MEEDAFQGSDVVRRVRRVYLGRHLQDRLQVQVYISRLFSKSYPPIASERL